ncbi:hypothetical protein [Pinisolibacter sp.]|uniref:hypothetical protein n=1 Tax=Pinisolibacter sp. TaxID=2172024 RepID=UPI002FDCD019
MTADDCLFREGVRSSIMDAIRTDSNIRLLYIYGISGVGKTALIESALQKEGYGQNREAFFFDRPGRKYDLLDTNREVSGAGPASTPISQFKNYLNNLMLVRRTRLSFLRRLISRDIHMEDAHLSFHRAFSFAITSVNKPQSTSAPVKDRGNLIDVNMSHGAYRLNGSVEVDFFEKLWMGLRASGCHHIHIGNIEYANEKEREYILLLAQFTPEDCCLVLEFGSLISDGREDDFRRAITARIPSLVRKIIQVEPFDEPTAREFHRQMAQRRSLPAFNYRQNHGIPICILNDISIIDSRYMVGERFEAWLRDPSLRKVLFSLAALTLVTDDRSTIEPVLEELTPKPDLTIFQGVVETSDGNIRFAHASFLVFLEVNYRREIREYLPLVINSLSKRDRFAAHALQLEQGIDIGDNKFRRTLFSDILRLYDNLRFPEVRFLFNAGAMRRVNEESNEWKILLVVDTLSRIQDLDTKSFRPSRLADLP